MALAESKPFAALPESVVNHDGYIDAAVSFQWSGIPVVLGCLVLVIGGSFLLAGLINLLSMHRSKLIYTGYNRVLSTYRLPMAAVLAGLLFYLSVVEGFASLAGTYLGLLWNLPMENILMVIGIIEVQLAILMLTETVLLLIGSSVPEKLYRITARCLLGFSMLGIIANTLTNLWFFCQSGFVLLLFWLYTVLAERYVARQEAGLSDILEKSGILDEIDL